MLGYAARGSNYPDAMELMETLFSLCKGAGLHQLCRRVNDTHGFRIFYMPGEPKPELSHCSQ
jgi:hypothetical protein